MASHCIQNQSPLLLKWKLQGTQSCLPLGDPMDRTVHRILQTRILEWVAFPFSRGSSQPRDRTQVSCTAGGILYQLSHKGSPRILECIAYPFSRGSSQPRNQTGVSFITGRFFTNWAVKMKGEEITRRKKTKTSKKTKYGL